MTRSDEERLVEAISAERFQPFLHACGGDRTVALRLYAWDGEVSRALQSPLRDLEVGFRNKVHRQLVGRFGREDWWTERRGEPNAWAMRKIEEAEDYLAQRNRPRRPCAVVAQLSFGFWVGLLSKGGSGNYEMKYWNPSLRHCFSGQRRQDLHDRLSRMLELRNRVAHHERIWRPELRDRAAHHGRIPRPGLDLEDDFQAAIALMRVVSPESAALHEKFSQVPQVLARRKRVLSGEEEIRL